MINRAIVLFLIIIVILQGKYILQYKPSTIEKELVKIEYREPEDTIEYAINKASELIGVDPKFIEAQWRLETGHFTSRRFINNNNFAGIAVYTDNHEGTRYINYEHCAYHYALIIRDRYPGVLTAKTIDEFVDGLQDGKYRWAEDKQYKVLIKKIYKTL
jgi:flagellum-specific peptidoglycan hydrolase FlgJ